MQILVTLIVTHSFPSPPPRTATITNCTIFAAKRIFLTVQVGISLRCVCVQDPIVQQCAVETSQAWKKERRNRGKPSPEGTRSIPVKGALKRQTKGNSNNNWRTSIEHRLQIDRSLAQVEDYIVAGPEQNLRFLRVLI